MHKWTRTDIEAMDKRFRGNLINGIAGFKPALLVGTADAQRQTNLAVFSNVFHVGAAPALIGMIVRPDPEGTERHTLDNIRATGVYTLNHFTLAQAANAHQTSARYPRNRSEFSATGFEAEWQGDFAAPFVAGAAIQLGLSLAEHQELAINNTHLIIGRVESVTVPAEVVRDDGSVNLVGAGSVATTGLDSYHNVDPGERFAYAKPEQPPRRLN